MKRDHISFSRGPLTGKGASILMGAFGAALITQLVTHLWIIGLFGVLMLIVAFCFTGIEFLPEKKLYREYYTILFFKSGKWTSYEEFKFVSVHGTTLKSEYSMIRIPTNIGTSIWPTGKIVLLNQNHTKKLFVIYSGNIDKTEKIISELSEALKMEIVKFNPPKSQKRKIKGR